MPAGGSILQIGGENSLANLFCSWGVCCDFPGCAGEANDCARWTLPSQTSYVWATDLNGDGHPEDLCHSYGRPYALGLYTTSGFLPDNLFMGAGLDCASPVAVQGVSWGRVKALFE